MCFLPLHYIYQKYFITPYHLDNYPHSYLLVSNESHHEVHNYYLGNVIFQLLWLVTCTYLHT